MVDFAERIKQLEAKVKEDSLRLKNIAKGILAKEQELKVISEKLFACQEEKESIQQLFNEKIKEIQNSSLSHEEKYQSTRIVINDSNDFTEMISKPLANSFKEYRNLREEFVQELQTSKQNKVKIVDRLFILVWVLVFLLSLSLSCYFKGKKRQKINNYD